MKRMDRLSLRVGGIMREEERKKHSSEKGK
jgi:hypothetical protein